MDKHISRAKDSPAPSASSASSAVDVSSTVLRLNHFIARSGRCSRRDADTWIAGGRVTVNGRVAELGQKVGDADVICVDGEILAWENRPPAVYIALNKPRGIVCTTDRREPHNIIDYLHFEERIFPIGRLDKESGGLLLLTNDGTIVNRILRAQYGHEKEYEVTVNRPLSESFLRRMEAGVPILDTVTQPCRCHPIGERRFRIVLTQGLNRQIRRMCEALDYRVVNLERRRIMHITLGSLSPGEWRELSEKELRQMKVLLEHGEALLAENPRFTESDVWD